MIERDREIDVETLEVIKRQMMEAAPDLEVMRGGKSRMARTMSMYTLGSVLNLIATDVRVADALLEHPDVIGDMVLPLDDPRIQLLHDQPINTKGLMEAIRKHEYDDMVIEPCFDGGPNPNGNRAERRAWKAIERRKNKKRGKA